MYIAVKGGERAIEASRQLLAAARRGDTGVPALEVAQDQQRPLLADHVERAGDGTERIGIQAGHAAMIPKSLPHE